MNLKQGESSSSVRSRVRCVCEGWCGGVLVVDSKGDCSDSFHGLRGDECTILQRHYIIHRE
jgi:hypothetical protein